MAGKVVAKSAKLAKPKFKVGDIAYFISDISDKKPHIEFKFVLIDEVIEIKVTSLEKIKVRHVYKEYKKGNSFFVKATGVDDHTEYYEYDLFTKEEAEAYFKAWVKEAEAYFKAWIETND